MRGLLRTFGVVRNTVTRWIKKPLACRLWLESCSRADARSARARTRRIVALRAKESLLTLGFWIALARHSRQVVAYVIGDRSERTYRKLGSRITERYKRGRCYSGCYSDSWEAYRGVNPEEHHEVAIKDSGELAHVERWNNTLRQRLSSYVRRFSFTSPMKNARSLSQALPNTGTMTVSLCVEPHPARRAPRWCARNPHRFRL